MDNDADATIAREAGLTTRRPRGLSASMIAKAIGKPTYPPGTRVRVIQQVRVGHRRWQTQVEGIVEHQGRRPVGGIEMGGKASYVQQPTIRLRRDDGEITEVAVDSATEVVVVNDPTAAAESVASPAVPDPAASVQAVTNPGPGIRP
jgi:hypothetical protein